MRAELSDEALADFGEAIDWYLHELAFDAAADFADEFDHALVLLVAFPELGISGQYETRALTLPKFPYSLIYRVVPGHIRIIAVAHHSRRPGFWSGRR
jgi:plasmid stabilization system protein ParE